MTRKTIFFLFVLIVAAVLLVDGRVPKRYCDLYLEEEWGRASTLRSNDEGVVRRPTEEETRQLRTAIRICQPFTSQFNLRDRLSDGEVWGRVSLITLAVELNEVGPLEQLVADGHSVNGTPGSSDFSPLQFATYRQADKAFHWLLDNGADPNLADSGGMTPLMYAATLLQDSKIYVDSLLLAGADINAVDSEGRPALAYAVSRRNYEGASLLVRAGADVDAARRVFEQMLADTQASTRNDGLRESIEYLDRTFKNSESE